MDGAPCPLATGRSMACRFGGALLGSNGSSSSGGLLMGMSSSASGDRLESMALSGLSSDMYTGQRTRPGDKCSDARRHHLSMAQGLLQVDEVGFDEGSWVSVRRVWVAKLPASVPRLHLPQTCFQVRLSKQTKPAQTVPESFQPMWSGTTLDKICLQNYQVPLCLVHRG